MSLTAPPESACLPALDRRTLLKSGVLGAGLAATPAIAQTGRSSQGFTHGVASGEPGRDRVLLWTRYAAVQDTPLTWQVLEADGNRRVIAEGAVSASPDNDFCAKAWATGLEPGRWYYFRFVAPDGTMSDLGRTRTLPEGRAASWKMAVFSCSNIGFGWFNAYAHAADAGDFDCALHLGDYFYEYPAGNYPSAEQTAAGRNVLPPSETVSLADYRNRFALYRSDRDLQRLHQLYPMIAGWDDHESTNDSWEGGAQNHQPDTEGSWSVRKAASMRAYREWMPVSDEPWAEYQVGNLATLYRLETRLTARAEQFDYTSILKGSDSPEETVARLEAFRDGTYLDPAREVLGATQQAWLAEGLKRSRRDGTIWQVLVQQVLMGKVSSATSLNDRLSAGVPDYVLERIRNSAFASEAGLPLNMDAWDGYPAARARVYEAALDADANLISLAGDTHNAWAFDLDHGGQKVGVEFGGHSVTSPGFEGYLPQIAPEDIARAMVERNPELQFMDSSQRGYMAVELTPGSATSEYRFLSSVKQKGAGVVGTRRISTLAGARRLDIA